MFLESYLDQSFAAQNEASTMFFVPGRRHRLTKTGELESISLERELAVNKGVSRRQRRPCNINKIGVGGVAIQLTLRYATIGLR